MLVRKAFFIVETKHKLPPSASFPLRGLAYNDLHVDLAWRDEGCDVTQSEGRLTPSSVIPSLQAGLTAISTESCEAA